MAASQSPLAGRQRQHSRVPRVCPTPEFCAWHYLRQPHAACQLAAALPTHLDAVTWSLARTTVSSLLPRVQPPLSLSRALRADVIAPHIAAQLIAAITYAATSAFTAHTP